MPGSQPDIHNHSQYNPLTPEFQPHLSTPVHANDHEAIFQPRDLEKSPASTTMHVIPSPPSKDSVTDLHSDDMTVVQMLQEMVDENATEEEAIKDFVDEDVAASQNVTLSNGNEQSAAKANVIRDKAPIVHYPLSPKIVVLRRGSVSPVKAQDFYFYFYKSFYVKKTKVKPQEKLVSTPVSSKCSSLTAGISTPGTATAGICTPGTATAGISTPGTATAGICTPGSATAGISKHGTATAGICTPGTATAGISTPGTATAGICTPGTATAGMCTPGTATAGISTPGTATAGISTLGAATAGISTPETVTAGISTPGTATTGISTPRTTLTFFAAVAGASAPELSLPGSVFTTGTSALRTSTPGTFMNRALRRGTATTGISETCTTGTSTPITTPTQSIQKSSLPSLKNLKSFDFKQIKLPPRIPKRGRPKGADQTVIGLPRKRHRTTALPPTYAKRSDKHRFLLECVLRPAYVDTALLQQNLVDGRQILHWTKINMKICDEKRVSLEVIKPFFNCDAWSNLETAVQKLKERNKWFCKVCAKELPGTFLVSCAHCLEWFDDVCSGLTKEPKKANWFCTHCLQQSIESNVKK